MKLAVSGKGGVGKTTLSAMLAGALGLDGQAVIALDADPDANLGAALGLPADAQPTPLAEMHDLIAERTGSADNYGGYFKLNPKVDDIPETFSRRIGRIRLLALGGMRQGGQGCLCPASALLKALLVHLVLGRDESLVMDMEAGLEHLGRATARSMDALIVVVDSGPWSRQTARRVRRMAGDIGMRRILAVANRADEPAELEEIRADLGDISLIGQVPYDARLARGVFENASGDGCSPAPVLRDRLPAVKAILSEVDRRL
ncbi:MAG TPA: AAA family ATPase [Phycisphaerae bacterium]|nr:AAA family ATPase [Phycisphaerae bacterium]